MKEIAGVLSDRDNRSNEDLEMASKTVINRSGDTGGRTKADLDAVLETEFEVCWKADDPANPLKWSLLKKGWILTLVSLQTLMVVVYSTSYVSGAPGMMRDFGITSETTIILGMTTYLLGLAVGPLLLAPLSEVYGRRIVYLLSLLFFFIFAIPECFSTNFTTILIVRFLAALAGSVTISNAPGTVGDIFDEESRPVAFSIYCLAPMNSPIVGALIGGFVYQYLGWRWINKLIAIVAGVFGLLGLTHPETYAPVLLRRRAAKLRSETGDRRYMSRFCCRGGEGNVAQSVRSNLARPVIMLFTEPICIFWSLYVAILYGILYLCFTAYPIVFGQIRGWGPGKIGLAFMGVGFGTLLAVAIEPLNRKLFELHKIDPTLGKRPPEARLLIVCLSSILIPSSILWFAWTNTPPIHWIWPILSGVPYGLGNTLVFIHANDYLVTSYDVFAASAVAGNAVARSILGAFMPLLGPILYHRLGPNLAATTVAIITFAIVPIPWAFYRWGRIIRVKSPMLQTLQKEKESRSTGI